MNFENVKMMFDPGFGHFFVEVSTATTNGPKASEAPRLPRKSSCVRNLTRPSSPREMTSETTSQESTTPATRMKKSPMSCTCHAKWHSRPQNVAKAPCMKNGDSSKNEHGPPVKQDPRKRALGGHHFVLGFLWKRKIEELLCSKGHQTRRTHIGHIVIMTPWLNTRL